MGERKKEEDEMDLERIMDIDASYLGGMWCSIHISIISISRRGAFYFLFSLVSSGSNNEIKKSEFDISPYLCPFYINYPI